MRNSESITLKVIYHKSNIQFFSLFLHLTCLKYMVDKIALFQYSLDERLRFALILQKKIDTQLSPIFDQFDLTFTKTKLE
jgi:hypothetical protein